MENKTITYNDFAKIDIRVGKILRVEEFPKARKPAYKLYIDFGELGEKQSSAQITNLYKPEDLIGRQIVAVVNFPGKQIADFISEVLVLGATDGETNAIVLLKPDRDTNPGAPIS